MAYYSITEDKGTVQQNLTWVESSLPFVLNPLVFIFTFKGNLLFKSQNRFQWVKPIYEAYQFQWGARCKELIAGISITLYSNKLEQYASFRYKAMAGSLLPLQITELVSTGKCGKIISRECEWAFHCQLFVAGILYRTM
jgi:hypothetical protein